MIVDDDPHIRQLAAVFLKDEGYDIDGWVGRSNGRDDQPTST